MTWPLRLVRAPRREVPPLWQSYEAAVNWLAVHRVPDAGISVYGTLPTPYPEVTGYAIPTLLECGERELALDLAKWLLSIQRPDGGFEGPDGEGAPYQFDTAQVMRGLLAVVRLLPDAREGVRKAADWMVGSADTAGVLRPTPAWTARYGQHISENIHLYALPPLFEAGKILADPKYAECAERSLAYYLQKPDLLRFQMLTHFYGYVLEALVEIGRLDLARAGLGEIVDAQWSDGGIPALPGASWVCTPGLAQMAVVGYKLGLSAFADKTLTYMQGLQMSGGGFRGSYGPGAAYGPDSEPSWANKYFLDACHLKIRTSFAVQQDRFRVSPDTADPRLPAVLSGIGDATGKRVLDVGCGNGQFVRAIRSQYPTAKLWGVDISKELLDKLPRGTHGRLGSMLDLPFPNASFDVVLCVEALEHALRLEPAVRELCRVLKPGGRIVIIDKDSRYLGLLSIEAWEQWFEPQSVAAVLAHYCTDVSWESLNVPVGAALQPFVVVWRGIRREMTDPIVAPRSSRAMFNGQMMRQYRNAQRQIRARRLVEDGFARYEAGDRAGARAALLSAVRHDVGWLRNRGLMSIVIESLIGARAARVGRATVGTLRAKNRGARERHR